MTYVKRKDEQTIQCPVCMAEAIYKYGHIRTGKQRYLCIMCGRQFTLGGKRVYIQARPSCPKCGLSMHLYKECENGMRFRCSDYPKCKTYTKNENNKEVRNELLYA